MKIAITSVLSNITYDVTNHRGLETHYLHKALSENGHQVDLVGKKGRTNSFLDFYKDHSESDFSEYDCLFLQLTPANFFGGLVQEYSIDITEKISKFQGKIYILVNDPRIKILNYAEIINKRTGKLGEIIDKRKSIIENAYYLFPGKDLNKFRGTGYKNVIKIDRFTYIFKQKLVIKEEKSYMEELKSYFMCYYGDKRGSYREKKVKTYVGKNNNDLLIGYKSKSIKSMFIPKLNHSELLEKLNDCFGSIVIGDKEHEDNVCTYRFFEILNSNCICFIDLSFDPNKELIQNEELKSIIYVDGYKDFLSKIESITNAYMNKIIDLQHEEIKRIFGNFYLDLSFLGE